MIMYLNQYMLLLYQTCKIFLGKDSGWIIDSIAEHNINISKYHPLAGSSCIKLPKELNHRRKGLTSSQNSDDIEFFKWCLVIFLHPVDHNRKRITKADKDFAKKLDFKDIKFPVKVRDIQNLKKIILLALVFLVMKIKKTSNLCMYVVKKNMLIYY